MFASRVRASLQACLPGPTESCPPPLPARQQPAITAPALGLLPALPWLHPVSRHCFGAPEGVHVGGEPGRPQSQSQGVSGYLSKAREHGARALQWALAGTWSCLQRLPWALVGGVGLVIAHGCGLGPRRSLAGRVVGHCELGASEGPCR